jgi:hypothetical protein
MGRIAGSIHHSPSLHDACERRCGIASLPLELIELDVTHAHVDVNALVGCSADAQNVAVLEDGTIAFLIFIVALDNRWRMGGVLTVVCQLSSVESASKNLRRRHD